MQDTLVTLTLPQNYVGQILDGIRCREEAYRHTAEYLENGAVEDVSFVCEEVTDAEEARDLAEFYQEIIACITNQVR